MTYWDVIINLFTSKWRLSVFPTRRRKTLEYLDSHPPYKWPHVAAWELMRTGAMGREEEEEIEVDGTTKGMRIIEPPRST